MTSFSVKNITKPTPPKAKIVFRLVLTVFTALNLFISGTSLIPENWKLEAVNVNSVLIFLTYAISKMFGIEKQEINPDE